MCPMCPVSVSRMDQVLLPVEPTVKTRKWRHGMRDERALSALGNEASLHCALLDASGVPFAAAVD